MKTGNYLNIFYAAAIAVALNACKYPPYETAEVFFLNRESLDMYLGDTVRIVASPGGGNYVWSSENEEVATVDGNGLVKAVAYGLSTIIVKSGNAEDRVDVHVREYIPLTGITPSVESVRFSPGNTFKLWGYPDPADASEYSFTWRTEDPDIVTVDRSGNLYAVSGGETNIIITSGDIETAVPVTVVDAAFVLKEAVGLWLFDDPDNLMKATIGNDLDPRVMTGFGAVNYYAIPDPYIKGITVGRGTYFVTNHGISQLNEEGIASNVNEYTLMFDFRIPATGMYYSFFQTSHILLTTDADCMINLNGQIGVAIPGYSSTKVTDNVWYRLVIAAKLPGSYDLFLDGTRIFTGSQTPYLSSLGAGGRFALQIANLVLFHDDNGDDNDIDASAVALWDHRLTDEDIAILGKADTYEKEED